MNNSYFGETTVVDTDTDLQEAIKDNTDRRLTVYNEAGEKGETITVEKVAGWNVTNIIFEEGSDGHGS